MEGPPVFEEVVAPMTYTQTFNLHQHLYNTFILYRIVLPNTGATAMI